MDDSKKAKEQAKSIAENAANRILQDMDSPDIDEKIEKIIYEEILKFFGIK